MGEVFRSHLISSHLMQKKKKKAESALYISHRRTLSLKLQMYMQSCTIAQDAVESPADVFRWNEDGHIHLDAP